MFNINKALDKVTETFDDNYESRQENEAERTRRLEIDNTSPFKLPHIIRPISFIWAMSLQTIMTIVIIVLSFMQDPVDVNGMITVIGSNTLILMTMIGFYFNSRKVEKVTAKKAMAAVDMNSDKLKAELKQTEIQAKHDRKVEIIETKSNRRTERKRRKDSDISI